MTQSWNDVLFAHWSFHPALLRPFLPRELELDLFEGRAWLSLAALRTTRARMRFAPPVPGAHSFRELNFRTYVRGPRGIKPGVWFFSLDVDSRVAVELARAAIGLPCFDAEMSASTSNGHIHYTSLRIDARGGSMVLDASYGPVGEACDPRPGSLDAFLSERYCVYSQRPSGALLRTEIHHRPWPLQPARWEPHACTVGSDLGIELPLTPSLLRFARRLDVAFWAPRRLLARARDRGTLGNEVRAALNGVACPSGA